MAGQFRINTKYAEKYNKFREKEELQKLKDKYGDREEGDSTSESDEEFASANNPQLDENWQRTMNALRNKDPKIYSKDFTFYDKTDAGKKTKVSKKEVERPYTVADMRREAVLKKMQKFDVNNEVESSSEEEDEVEEPQTQSYYAEQVAIKKSFQPLVADYEDDDDDGEDLFIEKDPSEDAREVPHDPYFNKWVKQLEAKPLIKTAEIDRSTMGSKDQLLMRFIGNKDYEGEDEQTFFKDDIKKQSTEEVEDDFRTSAPQQHEVKRHPRDNTESLRRKDDTRSKKRQDMKGRKEKKKKKKEEELKRLKNMKRKEIMDKIEQLKRLTGNEAVGFTAEDLDGNFDPKEYDQLMQKVFNEDYYGEEKNADEKPVFGDDEAIEWNEDWDSVNPQDAENYGEEEGYTDGYEPNCEDPDFNMDADYDPSAASSLQQESKKKGKKKSKLAKALERSKPVFEPEDKTFEEYFDEYYKLDYEDMIGDTPCRFKYRSVLANDYGLSAGEVLKADDKELNQWVAVRRITSVKPLDEELKDLKRFKKRASKANTKYNLIPSLKPQNEDKDSADEDDEKGEKDMRENEDEKPKKKKTKAQKKKMKANKKLELQEAEERSEGKGEKLNETKPEGKNKKKKKKIEGGRKRKRSEMEEVDEKEAAEKKKKQRTEDKKRLKAVSDLRLLAYGINPKKIKYGTKKKMKI